MSYEGWRFQVGTVSADVRAGQPLYLGADGVLRRTVGLPNCVALETIEMDHTMPERRCKVQMLDAQPPAWAVKICNCGHRAAEHRSNDDHCNVPGCNCERPSCGH